MPTTQRCDLCNRPGPTREGLCHVCRREMAALDQSAGEQPWSHRWDAGLDALRGAVLQLSPGLVPGFGVSR